MKRGFSSDDDTEDAAVGVARVFSAVPPDDVPSPRINSPRTVRGASFVSAEWDQASMESNQRVFGAIESCMDMMVTDTPQEGENGSDTTRASGGDGGRGDVAPPGVGHSSCAKGVDKDKSKVHDGIWMSDLSRSSHIMQPLDTNCRQELRQQWATMVDNGRSPEALQRRQEALRGPQKTIEAWKRRFGKRPRWDTEASERQTRIRTTNQPAAVAADVIVCKQ